MINDQNYTTRCQIGKISFSFSRLFYSICFRSSECSTSISSLTRRTSIRPTPNTEKYSGIKCTLPSFTSTVPTAFKGLEKHHTPVKNKLSTSSTSTSLMVRKNLVFEMMIEFFVCLGSSNNTSKYQRSR